MNKRYHALDSLRGIACLQVVIGHCLVSLPTLAWLVYPKEDNPIHDWKFYLAYSPIHFFWSATPAVIVFFVLSGFVLALPYYSGKQNIPNYLNFFIRRIIRLYLPCLCIILISLLCKYFLYEPGSINMFTKWVTNMWSDPESVLVWINRLLLNNEIIDINPALWTLPIEIKLSLILPFAIFILNRLSKLWNFIAVIVFTAIFYSLSKLGLKQIGEYNNLFYFTFFLWGALICKYRNQVCNWIDGLSNLSFSFLVIASLIIYTFNYTLWWLPNKIMVPLQKFHEYVSGLAAIIFIIIILSARVYSLFNSKMLMFFGKISFSLYLIHPVIIVSSAYLLHQYLNEYVIIFSAFLLSIGLSTVFYRYAEVPSLNFAKKVAIQFVNYRSKK